MTGRPDIETPKFDSTILATSQQNPLLILIGLQTKSFSLLWRGTKDGFAASTFHSLCDNKGSTLTVVKTTTGYIQGAYASVSWRSSNSYLTDSSAFVFSLTNVNNVPMKLAVTNPGSAVYDYSAYGPVFGAFDLVICNNANTVSNNNMRPAAYQLPNGLFAESGGNWLLGNYLFKVAEIEVFLVT